MALRLRGATSGYTELKAPASAGDNTLTLPVNNGSANQLLKTDGNGNLSWVDDNSGVSLSGSTNNTIATVTGANALAGEANLTFDGSTLALAGNMQFTAANAQIELNNGGPRFWSPSANTLTIHTGGGFGSSSFERLRIDSNGNILIGDTAGAIGKLSTLGTGNHISASRHSTDTSASNFIFAKYRGSISSPSVIANGDDLGNLSWYGYNGSSIIKAADITAKTNGTVDGSNMTTALTFSTTSGNTNTEKLRIDSSGEVGIGTTSPVEKLGINGNIRFINPNGTTSRITALPSGSYNVGTSGGAAICFHRFADGAGGSDEIFFETHWQGNRHGESCRITKEGNLKFPNNQGIDFSSTSDSGGMTSELLDDYEEGEYIPTITGSNSGSWTTTSYRYLAYTKIGRTVHIQGYLNISSESSPSGTCNISLPFAVNNSLSQNAKYPAISISLRSHNGSTNLYNVTGAPAGGTSYFQMVATAGNGVATWIGDAQIDGSWNVRIGGSYCV